MKTLHVIPNFEQSAITRELDLLLSAPGLEHFVCCLGADGPISSAWRADGNSVRVLNSKRWLDPRSIWQLADAIRTFQPDAIQSWGLCSLRAVLLTSRKSNACIAVRKAIPPERSLSAFERRLLRRADRVLARSRSEAARCVAAGVPAHKLFNVTPGVREVSQAHQIIKPLILCLGSLHPHRGFYDAIWAFDILHYAHNDLEIAIVGEGPDRRRLERLASSMRSPADIHLPGKTSDVDSWLARASVVWVTSLSDSGITTTLEAMSAGKPVIAYRRPSLAEFIVDGETGLLVEPSNKMALASQTLRLLQSPAHLLSFGEAGRRRVRAHYSPQMFLDAWMSAVKVSNSKIAPSPRASTLLRKTANVAGS